MKTERAVVYYNGHVQGVGFRYTCRALALEFSVTGYIKNLDDGRVELVAEGEREEIEKFLEAIRQSDLKPFIRNCTVDWQPASTQWKDFYIEH